MSKQGNIIGGNCKSLLVLIPGSHLRGSGGGTSGTGTVKSNGIIGTRGSFTSVLSIPVVVISHLAETTVTAGSTLTLGAYLCVTEILVAVEVPSPKSIKND